MNIRLFSAVAPVLLAISFGAWAQNPPKDTMKPADEAQMRKQCENMKNMDMSKMSAADHEAMMKKCKAMMEKDQQKPKSDSNN